ncbi:hypothetical protein B566_EDAN018385 [Ephemera danica]|nr:hypothetical protein B566_EDAN018385 [Ephemera danica]
MTVRFGGLVAVNNVSFDVRKGEVFTLIGPNGAGKTTVFNLISRIYQPTAGSISYLGKDLVAQPPHAVAALGIARTFQNIELFEYATVLQNLLIGRHTHRRTTLWQDMVFSRATRQAELAARRKAEEVIDLQHHRDSMIAGLPYGVRKVVELARALCAEPKLLLLDEPSSGLNVEETEDMAFWIQDIQRDMGLTVLMVEHDMGLVSKVSDRVLALSQGEVLATGTAAQVQSHPGVGCRMSTPVAEDILTLANVESAYGPIKAIRGVSLRVRRGEIVTVLGSNGAGKSTILKTISGILDPRKGSVTYKGQNITAMDPARIVQLGLSHVPEGREVFPLLSVHDNLLMGAYTRKDRDGVARDMEAAFAYFPILRERASQDAGLLSGGQQQMLAIARALMAAPELILLDEPSLGLSPKLTRDIFEIVVRINRERGTTMLLVEQNANMALNVADHGYVIETGRIVMEDSCERLREKDDIKEFYLGMKETGVRGERRWKKKKNWR